MGMIESQLSNRGGLSDMDNSVVNMETPNEEGNESPFSGNVPSNISIALQNDEVKPKDKKDK